MVSLVGLVQIPLTVKGAPGQNLAYIVNVIIQPIYIRKSEQIRKGDL